MMKKPENSSTPTGAKQSSNGLSNAAAAEFGPEFAKRIFGEQSQGILDGSKMMEAMTASMLQPLEKLIDSLIRLSGGPISGVCIEVSESTTHNQAGGTTTTTNVIKFLPPIHEPAAKKTRK
jgi:hypothetical protein